MNDKEQFIDEVVRMIEQKGHEVQTSGEPPLQQLPKVDILLDMIRFLDKYDENVIVLNNYWRAKRLDRRFSSQDDHIDID
jgi:hypothetical protein